MPKSDHYEGPAYMYQWYRGRIRVYEGTMKLVRRKGSYNNHIFVRTKDRTVFNFRHTPELELPETCPGGGISTCCWSIRKTSKTDNAFVDLMIGYFKERYAEAKEEMEWYEGRWYELRMAQREDRVEFA